MKEREAVGVKVGFEGSFVHQAADGEMGHHQPVEFLAHQVRGAAAQHDSSAAQMGLHFVECGLDLPAFVVEGGEFGGGRLVGIENGGAGVGSACS